MISPRRSKYLGLVFAGVSLVAGTAGATPREDMEKILFGQTPGIHTDAFMIIKDGKTVYERYARGYGPKSKHLSWSMGKTIGGLIAARAVDAGVFSLRDSLHRWIPTYSGSATLLDVFQMSSGIHFREEYSGVPVNSDATKMLYLGGPSIGFAEYTAALPLRTDVKPGEHFYYSSGDANLIMETMKRGMADQTKYDAYPWKTLFEPLGISATYEQDAKGTFVGSSYFYMTTAEYARIGQLLANRGKWGSSQLIPAWYFDLMNEVAPGVEKNALPGTSPTRAYSMQVTTNRPISGRNLPSEYRNLPEDTLLMIGHQGQLVIASPSENLVIVRMATDKGDPFNPSRDALFYAMRSFLAAEKGITLHGAGDVDGRAQTPGPLLQKVPEAGKPTAAEYASIPRLLRQLYAKELCSCTFVLGRTLAQCKDDLKQSLPVLPFGKIDSRKKTVTATLTDIGRSKAIYRGERLGCTLE
jgi:CubicO group peptidase (beta-lactamase class C family)